MAKTLLILAGVILVGMVAIFCLIQLIYVIREFADKDRVAARDAKNEALDATADLEAAVARAERKKRK